MKRIITILFLYPFTRLEAQQALSLRPALMPNATLIAKTGVDFNTLTNWGLNGVGNLNLETFKDVNISGKISGYKRLNKSINTFTTLHFSLNKNATNNDSLLATTFLFPDIGNASASLTLDHAFKIGFVKNDNIQLLSPYFDFAYKNIKATKDEVERAFSTLTYTLGLRYLNWYHDPDPNNQYDFISSISFYCSMVNVPNEDNEDYRILFDAPALRSSITSVGFKIGIQVNNLQFFADLKHSLGSEQRIPVRALRGFNGNVGIVFNAEIFER